MFFAAAAVFAQNGISLEAEIQNIEKTTVRHGVSAEDQHDALVRLARLRQLSGDIEGAAKNWLEAAAAIPGNVDDDALLACAYCLAAMGEWDRAAAALEPLLSKSPRAYFLDTSIKAIQSGDVSVLAAIADNPEYSRMKAEVYFMLWKTSGGAESENWRQRLIAEFPQSPEGRLAASAASAIVVKPSPFWLFMGGLDSLPVMEGETITLFPAAAERPAPAAQAVNPVIQNPAAKLQAGLFSRQANAEAQVENLKKAGFSSSLEQRGEMWAVIVPAGADTNVSIRELKDAGFDSFPIR